MLISSRYAKISAIATLAVLGCFGWNSLALGQQSKGAKPAAGPDKDGDEGKGKLPKSKRWRVSWAVDVDTKNMKSTPKPTSIAYLVGLKRPSVLPKVGSPVEHYRTHRVKPVETTIWQIRGTVVSVAAEHDGDYRLIVADAKGRKVCCVMPDPALAPIRGRFSNQVDETRAVVVKKFKPTFDPRDVKVPIVLSGIGYFGKINNDANPSPEGFQLHPVVKVVFPAK